MSNMFSNLSTRRTLTGGFVALLLLLVGVTGISYSVIGNASEGFTDYREMARDGNIASSAEADMLMFRMNVKDFIIDGDYSDLEQYSAYLQRLPPAPETIKPSPWFLQMPQLIGPPMVQDLT
jgi:methyl-accepting chemotaxis protein